MLQQLIHWCTRIIKQSLQWLEQTLQQATKPTTTRVVTGAAVDMLWSKAELIAENALLRQQLVVLQRNVKRPRLTNADRRWLVVLARLIRRWRAALLIVTPDTLLDWHQQLFKLVWRRKSAVRQGRPPLAPETIELIRQMARDNPLWGAERIRGELLKLAMSRSAPSRSTSARCARPARPRRPGELFCTITPRTFGLAISCR
jgi:putative transposase